MEASFSTVTSDSQRLLNSTKSFNNTGPETELVGTAATTASPAQTTPNGSGPAQTTPNGSAPAPAPAPAPGDNQAEDDSKPILIGIAAAILAGSFTLLANPPKSVHNVVLYKIYSLFLLPSFVLSVGSLFFILPTTPSKGSAWVRKKALQIAFISLIISVILRIFLQLSAPIKWYEVLVPVLLLGGISVCLFIGWIKTNDVPAQISSSALATSDEAVEMRDTGEKDQLREKIDQKSRTTQSE